MMGPMTQTAPRTPRTEGVDEPSARLATWPAVALAVVAFAAYLTLSLARWNRWDTPSWDNAIFEQGIRGWAGPGWPIVDIKGHEFNQLGDHFSPIIALVAPFYRVFPSPVTLLVARALPRVFGAQRGGGEEELGPYLGGGGDGRVRAMCPGLFEQEREKIEWNGMKGMDVKFPVIADLSMDVAFKYGMVQPSSSDTQAVRAVFYIDPEIEANRELANLKSITLSYTYFPSKSGQPVAESKGDAAKSSL